MKTRLSLLLMLLVLSQQSVLAGVTAWLDKYSIVDGDTLRLIIEADGDIPGDPDTQPLLKDFAIKGMATGRRQTRSKGGFKNHTTWTITLQPRQSGRLEIPPILINGEPTRAMVVEVKRDPKARASSGEVFIRTEVSNESPYVQSMVIYRVKIYYNIQLAEGSLSAPVIRNALVQRLGGDQQSTEALNGKQYRTIERRYAIFPQTSERLVIPAAVLNAKVPSNNQGGRIHPDSQSSNPLIKGGGEFDAFITTTRPIRVRSESTTLLVQPQPSRYKGKHWLPSSKITLTETLDRRADDLNVGDPVTRTLVLRAKGLTAEQLPNLVEQQIRQNGVYYDKPVISNQQEQNGVTGTLTQRIVYVARQPGTLELPEISLQWWNTAANKLQTATVPAHHYTVEAGGLPIKSAASPDSNKIDNTIFKKLPLIRAVVSHNNSVTVWHWMTAAFASLWLLTSLLWIRERNHRSNNVPKKIEVPQNNGSEIARKRFRQACRENLPQPARQYLLQWAASHWPDHPPAGLEALASRIQDRKLKALLKQLDIVVYSGHKLKWKGKALASRLKKLPQPEGAKKGRDEIPPLYPQG